jgi:hypothetical protein
LFQTITLTFCCLCSTAHDLKTICVAFPSLGDFDSIIQQTDQHVKAFVQTAKKNTSEDLTQLESPMKITSPPNFISSESILFPAPVSPSPEKKSKKEEEDDEEGGESKIEGDDKDYLLEASLTRSRKHRPWAEYEVDSLFQGIVQFGVGRWVEISKHFPFNHRSTCDVKDKWRSLYANKPQVCLQRIRELRDVKKNLQGQLINSHQNDSAKRRRTE